MRARWSKMRGLGRQQRSARCVHSIHISDAGGKCREANIYELFMRIEPEISAVTVVLRGAFNPSIFQPFWLVRNEIVTEDQGNSAQINIIHPQATEFDIPGQFSLHIDPTTFSITRTEAPLILAADAAVKIFSELLPHTPIAQLGINRTVHFSVGSSDERNRMGRLLAPIDPWGVWGTELSDGESPNRPDQGGRTQVSYDATTSPARSSVWACSGDHRAVSPNSRGTIWHLYGCQRPFSDARCRKTRAG